MYLGIDIGSSSSKAVIMNRDGQVKGKAVINIGTGSDGPNVVESRALAEADITREDVRRCVCTGYGRMLYESADKQMSEISCHAKGVVHVMTGIGTIIDIGGQDAKVIRLTESGRVENFVMNEKCAAGTGRFLEVTARVLGCPLEQLSDLAAQGKDGVSISSVCTVFAESEMISQLAAGGSLADVALGAHRSIAQRIAGLVGRLGVKGRVAMTGGVAMNTSLVKTIAEVIKAEITLPDAPQIMGALGAAKYALEMDDDR